MIRIEFTGTASEVLNEMRQFLSTQGAPVAGEDKPAGKPRASTKAATSSEAPSSAAGDASGNSASGSDATGAASGASGATGTATKEEVLALATQYGQKAGPAAVKELNTKHGSEKGNLSGVPDANLGALKAELESLLAA